MPSYPGCAMGPPKRSAPTAGKPLGPRRSRTSVVNTSADGCWRDLLTGRWTWVRLHHVIGDAARKTFVDRLVPVLATGDLLGAYELLTGLEGDELAEGKRWFGANSRWCRDLHSNVEFAGTDHDETYASSHQASWILAMCALVLCGPRTAADRVPWDECWDFMQFEGEAAFVHLLWDMPQEWVAEFVEAAAKVRLGGRARNINGNLSRVVRAAVVHHALPCPTGPTFLAAWLSGTPGMGWHDRSTMPLADWLAVDPLMPDLLHHFLASGDCGAWPGLPEAVGELVRDGRLERGPVVEIALAQLTTGQRPKSQRVLAGIVSTLDVAAGEVAGGLDYFLGVLASGHAGVQPVLLPLALQLAEGSADWAALADLVAGRPEKKAREMVLASLKLPATMAQTGPEAIAGALDVLGGVDDVAFVAKVEAVRATLGLAAPEPLRESAPIGLWNLEPVAGDADSRPSWLFSPGHSPSWTDMLGNEFSYRDTARPWMVHDVLASMAADTYDGSPIVEAARQQLRQQAFLTTSAAKTFEDLFLAGGLRQGWATAVEVADLAATAAVRPARLADLIRVLVRYGPEVPRPHALPAGLVALANDASRTKVAMEARALVSALGGAQVTAASRTVPRPRSGLWDGEVAPQMALPSAVALVDDPILAAGQTLAGLRELVSSDVSRSFHTSSAVCWWTNSDQPGNVSVGLTDADRVLASTIGAIHRHGSDQVRAALVGIDRRHGPVDVVRAVDTWAAGALDTATFWRLCTTPTVSGRDLMQTWREAGLDVRQARERAAALPPFVEQLHAPVDPDIGALVVPLGSPLERFAFLRATEALLRASTEPVLLSMPTWADGTLDVEVLIKRLGQVAAGSGVVGPLDLVQALHRLREADARLVGHVPGGLSTDPRFTDPDGVQSWDATALVEKWLAAGGLPALEPRGAAGRWAGAPTSPVPFASLAAWPDELADDPWTPGEMSATMRLYPRWADRVFADAFGAWSIFEPRHLPSVAADPIGVPFHDRLLALLTPQYNQTRFQCQSTLVFLARAGRLDAAAAATAARGRHDAGTLSLRLLTKALQRSLDEEMRGVWPMSLAIADALCTAEKRPAELTELLRVLTSYAHEVPADAVTLPPGLVSLAEAKGSTKGHVAARDLVGALHRAAAS